MVVSDGSKTGALVRPHSRHHYVMMFRASDAGLAKRVEFRAHNVNAAVELALADRACRTVDIIEDGEFLCRISREEASRKIVAPRTKPNLVQGPKDY